MKSIKIFIIAMFLSITSIMGVSAQEIQLSNQNNDMLKMNNEYIKDVVEVSLEGFDKEYINKPKSSDIRAYKYYSEILGGTYYLLETDTSNTIYNINKIKLISLETKEETIFQKKDHEQFFNSEMSPRANYDVWTTTPVLARNFSNVFSNYETMAANIAIGVITTLLFKSTGAGLAYAVFSPIAALIYRDKVKSFWASTYTYTNQTCYLARKAFTKFYKNSARTQHIGTTATGSIYFIGTVDYSSPYACRVLQGW